jgi:hypothetical protein
MFDISDFDSFDSMVRAGLQPGSEYIDSDGDVQIYDPREHYVGGDDSHLFDDSDS